MSACGHFQFHAAGMTPAAVSQTNPHKNMTPTSQTYTGAMPKVAGDVPAHLSRQVEIATSANLAEFSRLPKPPGRCPISGGSRSWLLETDAKLPPDQRFLVRVRRRGCLRGVVFVSVPKLCAFLRGVQNGEVEGFTSEGVSNEN
jgi:hypothetical protein